MKRRDSFFLLHAFAALFILITSGAGETQGKKRDVPLEGINPHPEIIAWVYFGDKGAHELMKNSVPRNVVSEQSIQRRLNVLPLEGVTDYSDLPVDQDYVRQVSSGVLAIRQQSKWFNAVSVRATIAQLESIENLPFVKYIEPVARFRRSRGEESSSNSAEKAVAAAPAKVDGTNTLSYGPSITQLNMMDVPAVHDQGNYGQGVIIGMFDNGFSLLNHEAFASMNILATYDFVDHKTSVVPNHPSTDYRWGGHGTNTLSTIGGFKPGQLIGPAFGATFILARTENDSSETPIEEDNWLAAIEWADSLGVQVTSTSLGYLTFDAPYTSLTWQDMNGATSLITRAAEMAVHKGIVVLNSAGNEGYSPTHNTLNAPADGFGVIAVGAVNSSGARTDFSSVGPTTDLPSRIKPDVMAQGASVVVASSTNPTAYTTSQGTSFSCPLAAGVAALMVHANPRATPAQIATAMRMTATKAAAPDNLYGWGIVRAAAAISFVGLTDSNGAVLQPEAYALEQNYPNPFNPTTEIRYRVQVVSNVKLMVFDVLGREVATLVNERKEAGIYLAVFNASGLASGVYFYRLQADGYVQTRKMMYIR
jgi:serine protease AprX